MGNALHGNAAHVRLSRLFASKDKSPRTKFSVCIRELIANPSTDDANKITDEIEQFASSPRL